MAPLSGGPGQGSRSRPSRASAGQSGAGLLIAEQSTRRQRVRPRARGRRKGEGAVWRLSAGLRRGEQEHRGEQRRLRQPAAAAYWLLVFRCTCVSRTLDVPKLHEVADSHNEADHMQDRAEAAGGEVFVLVVLEPPHFRDAILALEEGQVRRVDTSHVCSCAQSRAKRIW